MEFTKIKKSYNEEGHQIEKSNKKTLLSNTHNYSCPNFVTELQDILTFLLKIKHKLLNANCVFSINTKSEQTKKGVKTKFLLLFL